MRGNAPEDRGRSAPARPPAAPALALALVAAVLGPAGVAWAQQQPLEAGGGTGSDQPAEREGAATTEDEGSATGDDSSATARGDITLRADRERVRAGRKVTFSGRRQPARRGAVVHLKYKRAGGSFRRIERTVADGRGRFELSAKRRRSGRFVVVSPRRSGQPLRSRSVLVEVRPRLVVRARKHQLSRRGVKLRGRLRPSDAGRRVVFHRLTGKGWQRIGATRTADSGRYRTRWRPPGVGGYRLRARFRGDEANLPAQTRVDHRVYAYRSDHASYYGPGLYGNRTACGQTLRRSTVGVAHKSIRCGAKVRFHYRGKTRRIPVIDRGPFVAGRRWDLTDAARRKLDFPAGTDQIWATR